MSSHFTLRCRLCREPLGEVRNGDLEPAALVTKLYAFGGAELRYGGCRRILFKHARPLEIVARLLGRIELKCGCNHMNVLPWEER